MADPLQHAVQIVAYSSAPARSVAIFCAGTLLFVLIPAWLVVAFLHRGRLTAAGALRIALLFGLSYFVAKLLSHVISDPRPYLVQHIQPLIPLAYDNGFPSDHSLLAWALALSLCWLAPEWIAPFGVGASLVMLGRLGVAAHHTLDVGGSAAIVALIAFALGRLPLPGDWQQRIFTDRRWPSFLRVR